LQVAEYLQLCDSDTVDKVPFVTVVDGDDVLRRFVVDDQLIRMVRRCRERWHALQELGGVHNSYVSAAMENAARVVPEAEVVAEEVISEEPSQPDAEIVQSAEAVIDVVVEDVQSADTDEPYIDTASCTTCDECTNKNDRMFAYDDNKQAYIKDATAGTYRELVEAAEACQVAIIHPGKPLNPDEPGLEELVARAQPFMV
jgi:ferredoxin